MIGQAEYSASEIRTILQRLFPHRRLVLSQFTFFNHIGVATPTGETYRRGRRCYRIYDILPIATVLALKEHGIPLKNIEPVPQLIRNSAEKIFENGQDCRLSGFGSLINLLIPGEQRHNPAIEAFLASAFSPSLFWSFDVGSLAHEILGIIQGREERPVSISQAA